MAGTTPLYDREAGQWIEVADSEITAKVGSGRFAFGEGIDIPVVAPDGQLGTIPSTKAEAAFRDGFRWQTPEDRSVQNAKAEEAIKEKNFGDATALAATAGALRGATMGASDIVLDAVGLGDEAKELKDRNVAASTVGAIGGALASAPVMAGAAALSGAGKAVGTAATAALGTSKAAKVVQSLAPAALGSAAEGAFFGLGEGVSEAALGKPEDVVENLMANASMGALFGGVFGAGFQGLRDTAPLIKSVAKATYNKIDDLVQAVARKSTKGLVPVMRATGSGELADDVLRMVDDPEMRKLYFENPDAFSQVLGLSKQAQKDLAARIKDLDGNVRANVARLPKEQAAKISQEIAEAGGNLNAAVAASHQKLQSQLDAFKAELLEREAVGATKAAPQAAGALPDSDIFKIKRKSPPLPGSAAGPVATKTGQVIAGLYDDTINTIKQLERSGDSRSQAFARQLQTALDAEIPKQFGAIKHAATRAATLTGNVSVNQEVRLAMRLREMLGNAERHMGKYTDKSRDALKKFMAQIDDKALRNHPDEWVSSNIAKLMDQEVAHKSLAEMVKTGSRTAMGRVFADPAKTQQMNALMDQIAEFAPEMQALGKKTKDLAQRQTILENAAARANELLRDAPGGRFTPDDMDEFLEILGGAKDVQSRVQELKRLQGEFAAAKDLSPINKFIQVQRALGRDVSKNIEELVALEPAYEAMDRLRRGGSGSTPVKAMWRMARVGGASAVNPALGTAVAGAEAIGAAASSPYRTLKALTAIERMSNAGAKKMDQMTQKAVDGITSEAVRKAAMVAGGQNYGERKSAKEIQAEFKKNAEMLRELQVPEKAVEYATTRLGSIPGAPLLQAQMQAQMMKTAQFLASKLPQDPFLGTGLGGDDSRYMPSDYELAAFNRYVKAAQDPGSVMENVAKGTVSMEEVETLKVLYPGIYNKLQTRVLDAITKKGAQLSYQQKLTLGALFDVPSDITLRPDFVASMQEIYFKEQQDKGGRPEGKSIKIDLDPLTNFQTDTARITNK